MVARLTSTDENQEDPEKQQVGQATKSDDDLISVVCGLLNFF